jgi:hypothetical protein
MMSVALVVNGRMAMVNATGPARGYARPPDVSGNLDYVLAGRSPRRACVPARRALRIAAGADIVRDVTR